MKPTDLRFQTGGGMKDMISPQSQNMGGIHHPHPSQDLRPCILPRFLVNCASYCVLAYIFRELSLEKIYNQGRSQDLGGGAKNCFVKCALLGGGSGACSPEKFFLKQCNLVRFRVYFDQILSLLFIQKLHFYINNKYFRYTLAMGCFS